MTDNEIANEYKMYTPEECLQKIVDQHKEINRLQARVEKCEKVEHFADKTIATLQAENERLKKLEENNMSSAPWGNETERADYYQKELEIQRAICKRLDEENEKLKTTNTSLSKEIINAKIEMYKQCIEEMREKIVNTPFEVDLTGKTNEYKNGWLDGLVSKQHNILDMLDNLLKEFVGENQ